MIVKFFWNSKTNFPVIILCFDDNEQQRRFAIALADAGMNTNEYLYIIPDADMKIAGTHIYILTNLHKPYPIFSRPRRNSILGWSSWCCSWRRCKTHWSSFSRGRQRWLSKEQITSIQIANNFQVAADTGKNFQQQFSQFSQNVMSKMSQWPFYCTTCNRGQNVSFAIIFLKSKIGD